MGVGCSCDTDYTAEEVWKAPDSQYGGEFFSVKYAEREELFPGLKIWEDETFWHFQGSYPVISLFCKVKEKDYWMTVRRMNPILTV